MPWSDDAVEHSAKSLDAMSAMSGADGLSTKVAIAKLADRVWKLRRAGLSWEAIAEGISAGGVGVAIKAATLRSYLRGTARTTKKKMASGGAGARAKEPKAPRDGSDRSIPEDVGQGSAKAPVRGAAGDARAYAPKDAAREGQGTKDSNGKGTTAPGRASFVPRGDTSDL